MTPDEQELETILKKIGLAGVDTQRHIQLRADLLRWKRGDKWWCQHISWNMKNKGWHAKSEFDTDFLIRPNWDICPECHAPKPKEPVDG